MDLVVEMKELPLNGETVLGDTFEEIEAAAKTLIARGCGYDSSGRLFYQSFCNWIIRKYEC